MATRDRRWTAPGRTQAHLRSLAHDDRKRPRAILAAIVAGTFADLDEAQAAIERQRRRVVLIDLEEHRPRARVRRLPQDFRATAPGRRPGRAAWASTAMVRISASSAASRASAKPRKIPLEGSSAAAEGSSVGEDMARPPPADHGWAKPAACRRAQASALSLRSGRITGRGRSAARSRRSSPASDGAPGRSARTDWDARRAA